MNRWSVHAVLCVVATLCTGVATACPLVGVVRHVETGALFTLEMGEKRKHIQLAGIEVPDTPNSLSTNARSALGRLVMNKQVAVHCVNGAEVEPVLGLVRKGQADVAELLLAQGMVKTGRNAKKFPRYRHLEFEARRARRGLWAYEAPEQAACTLEVRQCTDGTYVGRQPPSCEFSACPDGTRLE
ncbi:MAG: thermonuclease family protein [Gammaproteobacteria bacterium]|nr:thermonuclease family protein [Gammaproteobacteria bacterium]